MYCHVAPVPFTAKILVAPALKLLYQAESAVKAVPLIVQVNDLGAGVVVVVVTAVLSFLHDVKTNATKRTEINFFISFFCFKS